MVAGDPPACRHHPKPGAQVSPVLRDLGFGRRNPRTSRSDGIELMPSDPSQVCQNQANPGHPRPRVVVRQGTGVGKTRAGKGTTSVVPPHDALIAASAAEVRVPTGCPRSRRCCETWDPEHGTEDVTVQRDRVYAFGPVPGLPKSGKPGALKTESLASPCPLEPTYPSPECYIDHIPSKAA